MISSISKIAYIIPVGNAWPEIGESAIKRIKTNKYSTMKNDALNALLMISINGPKSGTLEEEQLIVRSAKKYGERRRYKKAPTVGQTEMGTQTSLVAHRLQCTSNRSFKYKQKNVWIQLLTQKNTLFQKMFLVHLELM